MFNRLAYSSERPFLSQLIRPPTSSTSATNVRVIFGDDLRLTCTGDRA
jgi:hypothetical protein